MASRPLVLASTSEARRALLDRLGLEYVSVAPTCDENEYVGSDPAATARLRALAKAESVARERPDAIVLGSDQLVELDGEILGKPGTAANARAQLGRLAGRVHQLITAVAMVGHRDSADRTLEPTITVDVHRMTMRALDESAIARYVAADFPEQCAGSYRIESLGISLFDRVEGNDWTAIVGLPLLMVCSMLRSAGWALP